MLTGHTREMILQAFQALNPQWKPGGNRPTASPTHPRRAVREFVRHFEQPHALPLLIPGLRRIGKTTAVQQALAILTGPRGIPPQNALYIDCQESLLAGLRLRDIYRVFDEQVRVRDHPCMIAIDEVQYLERWHLQLRDLIRETSDQAVKILATGSNPGELSRASGRELLDRVRKFPMRTMTFGECLELTGVTTASTPTPEIGEAFERYLFRGGFPALWWHEIPENEGRTRVREICDRQVVDGDIAARLGIRNRTGLRKLWAHLVTHPGVEASANAIAKGLSLGVEGVGTWMEGLLQVELLVEVLATETSGEVLHGRKRHSRLFPSDPAFAAAYGLTTEAGVGLETLVLRQLNELVQLIDPAASHVGFWKSRGSMKSRDIDFRLLGPDLDLPISVKGASGIGNDDVAKLAVVAKELGAPRALLTHMGRARQTIEKHGVRVTALPVLEFLLRADSYGGDLDALLAT